MRRGIRLSRLRREEQFAAGKLEPSGPKTVDQSQAKGAAAGVPVFLQPEQASAAESRMEILPEQEPAPAQKELPAEEEIELLNQVVASVPEISGAGESAQAVAHSLTLEGRTDADFDGGTFRTEGVQTSRATGCEGCDAADCVRVRGTLVSTFHVTTTVSLPSVDDFPNLTACQRRRVQNAITTVLAPHEQRHVQKFRQYNGTVRTPFDLTICRTDFDSTIQTMHNGIDTARQDSARAASAALDPFSFTVDLDCED